jgi:hypothetical protein
MPSVLHPYGLSKKNAVTSLIYVHKSLYHTLQTTVSITVRKHWLVTARNEVRYLPTLCTKEVNFHRPPGTAHGTGIAAYHAILNHYQPL